MSPRKPRQPLAPPFRMPRAHSCSALRVLLLAAATPLLLATGCKQASEPPPSAVPVQATKAQIQPITEYIAADTVLVPRSQAAIVPKITAPVRRYLVQRGAHVRKGQLLVVLDNSDLSAAVEDSRGAMVQADAAYATTTRATVLEDRQKAQLDVAQAAANLKLQQTILDARQNLFKQGAIPRRDLDTAQASMVQAKATYDIAEQHLKSLQSVSQAATVQGAQGALESAQGKYKAAQANFSYSEIRSPIDGVVTDRPLYAGEMANSGQAIVTVMELSNLIAKVHLTPEQAAALKIGSAASLSVPGFTDPVPGKVSLISPALDPGSTTLEVWVQVDNRAGAFKAGTPVHVSIAARTVQDAIVVPNEAVVQTKAGEPAVMVVGPDSVAHETAVKLGIKGTQDTQILSGVKPGDTVVTTGAYGMDDGTKVKITAPGADDQNDASGAADDEKKPAAGTPEEK